MTTKLNPAQRDRLRGSFLGLFVGDALGTTLEFSSRDSLPRQTEITGGGPFGLPRGAFTDDGSMALALAESLIVRGAFDAADACTRWLRWYRQGHYSCTGSCFDIGSTTRAGLLNFERTGTTTTVHRALAARPAGGKATTGATGAGNGGIMRLAPAAVAYALRPLDLTRVARLQSECTHPAEEASLCAELLTTLIHGLALRDYRIDPLRLVDAYSGVNPLRQWLRYSRKDVSSSGRARDTLEASCWAVGETTSFEEALVLAVNLADDSDSVGAVTGQIAGAIYGADAIPERWSSAVMRWPTLCEKADALCDLAERLAV